MINCCVALQKKLYEVKVSFQRGGVFVIQNLCRLSMDKTNYYF